MNQAINNTLSWKEFFEHKELSTGTDSDGYTLYWVVDQENPYSHTPIMQLTAELYSFLLQKEDKYGPGRTDKEPKETK